MKKSSIIGIIIFLTIIIFSIIIAILSIKNDNIDLASNTTIKKIYDKYSNDVDSAVQEFMSSDEYNKMAKNKQIENIGELLEIYEENHIIKNLCYDEFGQSYTFTYNKGEIKGALGGVLLKDWNPMMN